MPHETAFLIVTAIRSCSLTKSLNFETSNTLVLYARASMDDQSKYSDFRQHDNFVYAFTDPFSWTTKYDINKNIANSEP